MLTKDQILQAKDKRVEKVECPEWGGHVFVRTLTADKRDAFEASLAASDTGTVGARSKLVAACMCDESGSPIEWTESEVSALGKKSAAVVDRIADRCLTINRMRTSDIEVAEKNSVTVAENDSGSN